MAIKSEMVPALRPYRQLIVSLWLICMSPWVLCQELPLRYYNQRDGLGNMAVTAMAQEPGGYLWIGTQSGLFRYDGARFQHFGQSDGFTDSYIRALHADVDGNLWVGASDGLYRWQGQRFVPIKFQNAKLVFGYGQNLTSLGSHRLLAISHDRLWLVTSVDQGATWQTREFFGAEQLLRYPEIRKLHGVHIGPHGDLWMGCEQALCHYDKGKLVVIGKESGLPAESWVAIFHDRQATLWIRSQRHVFALPAGGHVFLDRSPPQNKQKKAGGNPFLAEDAAGRVFSRQDEGIIRWNGTHWESFDESNGLTIGGGVNSFLVDRDGGIWIGSLGHGLIHWLGYPNWENWTSRQGLPSNVVLSFLRDRENVFHVGTRSGSAILQQTGQFSVSPGTYGGTSYQWSNMVEDVKGNIWASSYSGFLVRRDQSTQLDRMIARLPAISGLFFDRSGQAWLSTKRGIYNAKYPESNPIPLEVSEHSSLKDIKVIQGCQSRSGAIWFITEKEVLRFDGERWSKPRLQPTPPSVRLDTIACASDGELWLGDEAGRIWRAMERDDALEIHDATPPLLLDQAVVASLVDSRGWLWVTTGAGIAVWNRAQWRFFNQESGLVWNDSNQNALYEDSDGSMWVGTSNGASHILRPESLFAPSQLEVLVESVSRDGEALPRDKPIRLPWSSGPLNFKLAALSYQNREALNFRYRMRGLEPEWSMTNIPEVRYAALPPGRYHFQVAVDNPSIQAFSSTVEVEVVILPPWWRTKTFYTACGLLLVLALFLMYHYRIRWLIIRQRRKEQLARERAYDLEVSREEERKHLTREIHDELGQHLSAARMRVSMLGMEFAGSNSALQGKIDCIITLMDTTIKVVRNVVSSLRPSALDMGVVSALEWLADEFTGNTGIPCSLEVSEENIALDDKRATTIFRIAQESLTNISRHAAASQVEISLKRMEKNYLLEVRDNGRGFDTSLRKKKSFGLIGIRERTLMLGGEIAIFSVSGVGTTIKVSIPLTDHEPGQ
ncbi:histidine kinase-, DNA gyrase B-, and HSP90-like ATPase family protein [Collimonas fungivorans]|uniref:Histidine kinase-, DNA gyrase B-, and HSP90-like ATPase family protein n=1 Tax=Collimonas fungivorans TaxID=158899 RepID=A0A127P6L1_9BURK|nr:sensor histidine kinase [Collimonas fungivorans]AMO93417.1 histidine kinase-, DNA gyrase B-, and HSP90-like ATPase family protein [Collimonas fungivorans]